MPAILRRLRLRDHLCKYQVSWIYFFLSSAKPETKSSTSAPAVKRDQGRHKTANSASANEPRVIHVNEITNMAFRDDDDRAAKDSMLQNESRKAFVLKPFKVVKLSNDESNVQVRLKL